MCEQLSEEDGLDKETIEDFKKPLKDGLDLLNLLNVGRELNKKSSTKECKRVLGNKATLLQEYLKIKLEKTGDAVYLPSGWKGKPSGHFCLIKFYRTGKGQIGMHFINAGAGASYHKITEKDGEKIKRDLRSPPVFVDPDKLFSKKLGHSFLTNLIFMQMHPKAGEGENPINDEDLYGLLYQFSDEEETSLNYFSEIDSSYSTTQQRSGSCASYGVLLSMRDHTVSKLKRKKKEEIPDTWTINSHILLERSLKLGFQQYYQEIKNSKNWENNALIASVLKSSAQNHLIQLLKNQELLVKKWGEYIVMAFQTAS